MGYMNWKILPPKKWLPIVLSSVIVFTLTGCLTPDVETKPGAKLDSYRKVYVIQRGQDPRGVGPRLSSLLSKTGFQVVDVKSDSKPAAMQGSGFIITPDGHLLTCAHVVMDQPTATVWIGGQRYLGKVLVSDTNIDLAAVLIDGNHAPFVPLSFSSGTNYSLGQDAYSMGFPLAEILGSSPRLNKGMISAVVGTGDDPKFVQFSAPVQPGDSGGPLLNARGEVIGVITSTLNPVKVMIASGELPQNVNFAIKTDPVRSFLASAKISLPLPGSESSSNSFDNVQKSLALVRAGNVTEEELKKPAVICVCRYVSFLDMWYRFRLIELRFYDWKTGDLVFRVGQYRDDPFSTEEGELNRIFAEISGQFFPGQPNPFRPKK